MLFFQSERALMVFELCLLRIDDQPKDLPSDAFDINDRFVVEDMILSAEEATLVDSSLLLSGSD